MLRTKLLVLAAVVVCGTGGCVSDVANRYYGDIHYAAKAPEDVEVLRTAPTRPYVVIADFQSRGDTESSLRRKAAGIGADAVIVSFLGGLYNNGDQWAGSDSQGGTYSRAVGTAIKYK